MIPECRIFLLVYIHLTLVNADGSACIVFREDNPNLPPFMGQGYEHSSIRVDYCSPNEKCCKTGCCPKVNGSVVVIGLLLMGAVTFCTVTCCKKCCEKEVTDDRENRRTTPLFRINTQYEQGRNQQGIQQSNYSGFQNVHINLDAVPNQQEVTVQVENSADPVTPPPSYDVAVNAPSAPPDPNIPLLRPDNRIPSYEDVTSGRIK